MRNYERLMPHFISLICLFVFGAGTVAAQKECRPTGAKTIEFTIKNDLKFDIEVKSVNADCSEGVGYTVGANRAIKVASFGGQVYRLYENWTDRMLAEITLNEALLIYPITGFESSDADPSKKLCSRVGEQRPMSVRNATGKPIVIKFVANDCAENSGPTINPGKQVSANTFVNNVFRAYKSDTGTFLSQFVIRPSIRNYVIGGEKDPDPAKSFVKTVNLIRSFSSIAPLELNDTLNSTCRWFAEFMSGQDQDHAGHLVTDFTNDNAFKDMNTPTDRLKHFDWKKSDNAETTAVLRTEEPELIGAYFVMEWSSSTTHFMPFYDLYKTKYKNVGFAAVPSKNNPDMYYGCAIFANE